MSIVSKLAQELKQDEATVSRFLSRASHQYKVFTIPKRKQGRRVIAQPSKKLKYYQNTFLKLYPLPIHSCAMAYRKGQNIKENALAHCQQSFLLKMDFENFFNSIKPNVLWKAWESSLSPLLAEDKIIAEQLLFWCPSKKRGGKLVLSVGAPSSPSLSNLCMYQFDDALTVLCKEKKIIYTRYADDLTFSTDHKFVLFEIPLLIKQLLVEFFDYGLLINHNKTIFSSMAHNRHVTGITLTNKGALSLGRKRKRYIKHLIHQFKYNSLDEEDTKHLQGLLAFAKYVEPSFIKSMKNKYSEAVIWKIFEARNDKK